MVTVLLALASAATAHFHQTNWSMVVTATPEPVISCHALPPLASVGTVGAVAVAVAALPTICSSSRSFGFAVAGVVTVNVPEVAELSVRVLTVRKIAGSIT